MNSKHAAWWLAAAVITAIALPFLPRGSYGALHEGLTLALATLAFLGLGIVLTQAVTTGIPRDELQHRLGNAAATLVVLYGYGFAPKPAGGFIIAFGCLIAIVGGLRYTRRKVKEQGAAQNAAP